MNDAIDLVLYLNSSWKEISPEGKAAIQKVSDETLVLRLKNTVQGFSAGEIRDILSLYTKDAVPGEFQEEKYRENMAALSLLTMEMARRRLPLDSKIVGHLASIIFRHEIAVMLLLQYGELL